MMPQLKKLHDMIGRRVVGLVHDKYRLPDRVLLVFDDSTCILVRASTDYDGDGELAVEPLTYDLCDACSNDDRAELHRLGVVSEAELSGYFEAQVEQSRRERLEQDRVLYEQLRKQFEPEEAADAVQ